MFRAITHFFETLLGPFARFSDERVSAHGAQYDAFAIFGIINYIIPYFMWPQEVASHFGILYLRAIASFFCLLILTRNNWPHRLKPYLPLLWHLTLLFCLPFLASYMLLDNNASTSWLMNVVLAVFLLVLLVDWLSFILILGLGFFLGGFVFYLVKGRLLLDLNTENISLALYMYLFSIVIGVVFSRNKEKINQEKISVMSLISGSIAHEMRTPLASISVTASALSHHLPKLLKSYKIAQKEKLSVDRIEPVHLDHIEEIPTRLQKTTNAAQTMVDMLLIKLRPTAIKPELDTLSIKSAVQHAIDSYPLSEDDKALINIDIEDDFKFQANQTLFTHLIFNLLKNALHYVKTTTPNGQILISNNPSMGKNTLIFQDTGPGIPPDQVPYVFDKFFSKTKHGSGIGLAFCRLVMRSFGGSIKCASEVGKYTEFTLTFPSTAS